MNEKLVSIAIPCYEMHGKGVQFLNESLLKIKDQSYKNIQVIISDHSLNDEIEKLTQKYKKTLNIKYLKNNNKIGSSSNNINNAINNSDGEIIKIIFQDDFLFHPDSIYQIVKNFDDQCMWMASMCNHTIDGKNFFNTMIPTWNDNIIQGINTISSPSVISINKKIKERFDEDLIYFMDCEMYYRLYKKYGIFKVLNDINVTNRILWGKTLSETTNENTKKREINTIIQKHNI